MSVRHFAALALTLGTGLALLVVLATTTPTGRQPTGSNRSARAGADLEQLVDDFVAAIPRRDSEAMEEPTRGQALAFTESIAAARRGRIREARGMLDSLAYDLVLVPGGDADRDGALLVFRERRRPDGTWPHGWGLYVFRSDPETPLVVQVPHPLYDVHTPELGVAAFRRGGAASLFVAGTHRYSNHDESSDVAHNDESMFQHVTRAVVDRDASVLQFHGYAEDSFEHYGEAVVSDGSAPPSAPSVMVADALSKAGFTTCLYDGTGCSGLAATTNVQGRWARSVDAGFLHVEVVRHIRDDPVQSMRFARLVVDTLRRQAGPAWGQ